MLEQRGLSYFILTDVFDGFEKNNKYTPNTSLIAESIYAITSNGISVKKYPTEILIAQIRPKYIIDFPCTK